MSPMDATSSARATMLRSEEQLTVARTLRITGAVRLHKRIVTETITQTVDVRREELVITEVAPGDVTLRDIDQGDQQLSDREFELILHEERVVMNTVIIPVERVRVRVHVVTDQVQIEETLRREHVDTQRT